MASTTSPQTQKRGRELPPRSESKATGSRRRNVEDSPFQAPFTSREYRRRSSSVRHGNNSRSRERSIDDGKADCGEERSRGRPGQADSMIFCSDSLAPSTLTAEEADLISEFDPRSSPDLQSLKIELRLKEKHLELWDVAETVSYPFSAEIHLMSAKLEDFTVLRELTMDSLTLDCRSIPSHNKRPVATYSVSFAGQTVDVWKPPEIKLEKGIHMGRPWQLAGPTYYGKTGTWGWWTRFWVPVPVCLLDRVETRMFRLSAQVRVTEGLEPLEVSEVMSVSHLRREKEMK